MATLDWPIGLKPSKVTWGLQSNTESFTSPLNRSTQTLERPGARWKVQLEMPHMDRERRGMLEAFLASLGGMAGRFTLWPHHRAGSSLYAPLVNGAMSDFKSLPTKAWPANTLVLRAGDFLSAGGELKMVTADVTSNASGLAAVPVAPAYRKAPAAGSAVTTDRPRALMMLSSDEYSVTVLPGMVSDTVTIGAVEVFQ